MASWSGIVWLDLALMGGGEGCSVAANVLAANPAFTCAPF